LVLRPPIFAPLFAALLSLAQNVPKQLTPRELFYAATQPPAPAAPATPKAQPKSTARPVHTPPKPVEIARAEPTPNTSQQSPDAGVKVTRTAAVQTAPMPANGQTPLGLRMNVLRYNSDGSTADVLPGTVFHSGDRIRLSVEPNARGYLYVVNQGASGTWKAMFPSPEIEDGNNKVEAMRPCIVPPGQHVFTFDATAGKENLFVVFSRQPVADFEDLIYSLKGGKKAAAPESEPRTDKTLIMAANIGNNTIDHLRNAHSRDLIIETVNTSNPSGASETAVYVVNPTGSADSRVVADIKLVHE
jgi:hypothetical protein